MISLNLPVTVNSEKTRLREVLIKILDEMGTAVFRAENIQAILLV